MCGSAASTASAPVAAAIRSSSPASVTAATYDGIVLEEAALTLAILAFVLAIAALALARRRPPDRPQRGAESARGARRGADRRERRGAEGAAGADCAPTRSRASPRTSGGSRTSAARSWRSESARQGSSSQRRWPRPSAASTSVCAAGRDDLDRSQQTLETELRKLEQRQKQLIAEAEARIEAEASELVATSDEQRASVLRLREELERAAQQAVAEALEELEAHTTRAAPRDRGDRRAAAPA